MIPDSRPTSNGGLALRYWPHPTLTRRASTSSLEVAIADLQRYVVLAMMDDTVVGWAKTHFWDHSDGSAAAGHYLGGVTVTSEFRRQGIGDALTSARLDWIWKRARNAWFVVNALNLASIDLHRKWGFCEVARSDRFHTTTFTGGEGILFSAESR
nr:GNAT family N-acetyltransferase [Cryobacterium roopkundense]